LKTKLLLFIPTYNCEKQIPKVISQVTGREIAKYFDHILVLDNGSSDNTIACASKSLESSQLASYTLAQTYQNDGLGGSLKKTFEFAIRNEYSHVVVIHGDDQATLADLLPVLQSAEDLANCDLIVGARFHPQSVRAGYSLTRELGNRALNLVCSLVLRRRIFDLVAGLNIFSTTYLKKRFFMHFPNDLTFDFHCLIHACLYDRSVKFVPITWREEDQVSNARVLRQGFKILSLLAGVIFHNRTALFKESQNACITSADSNHDVWQVLSSNTVPINSAGVQCEISA
jgi:dolichol-phosphate mannosyltransferase